MFDTIVSLRKKLKNRELSVTELTQDYLRKIEQLNPQLNAYTTINRENALEKAKALDANWNAIADLPLAGIPIAHKDIFCTKGIKTSCGSKMLDNFISPYDATVVSKLNDAHTVMLGKTNMDEFAMGSSSENSFYGPCKNPWATNHVPGGSSGGSAAAIAAGLTPAASGTDTGGSIRQPASFCGITGIKPTYGRVSRYGMIAYASSLDQGGPMAHTVEDCALMLQAMVGFDPKDSTSMDRDVEDYNKTLTQSIKGLTIGLPSQYFDDNLDSTIANLTHECAKTLESLGAIIKEVQLPHLHLAVPAYYVVAPAECSSNLARYDGVRYGYRCENPTDLNDLYTRSRGEAFGDEVKRRIMIGTYTLSTGYYDAYYLKAQKVRNLIRQDFINAFESVDALLGPTCPTTAFAIGEKTDDPIAMYLSDIYTVPANLAGLPALSMPIGFSNGLPVGGHLVGNYFDESKLLNIGHQYQLRTQWHQQHPTLET